MVRPVEGPSHPRRVAKQMLTGAVYGYVTSTLVLAAAWLGAALLPPGSDARGETGPLARLDGRAYARIVHSGYWYHS
ncbi:MAG: hypothetical protein ACREJB_11840, partial [Planctomycetaceae bacterium]